MLSLYFIFLQDIEYPGLLDSEKLRQVDESDTLVLNKVFASKRLKLKITGGVTGETPQQHQATMDSIEEDRKLYLQAAIVRIMKARKVRRALFYCFRQFVRESPFLYMCVCLIISQVLTHAQLVQETIQQSKARNIYIFFWLSRILLLIFVILTRLQARFTPNIPMIKKCIEQLIEKDYLARVEHNKYSYVA